MGKPVILTTWCEVSQGFLEDGPPKQSQYKAWLFVNRCELRRRGNGVRYLIRSTGVEILTARSRRSLYSKVAAFVKQPDVRMLAEELEANDFDTLPRQENDPDQSVIDGTADIYAALEAIA